MQYKGTAYWEGLALSPDTAVDLPEPLLQASQTALMAHQAGLGSNGCM